MEDKKPENNTEKLYDCPAKKETIYINGQKTDLEVKIVDKRDKRTFWNHYRTRKERRILFLIGSIMGTIAILIFVLTNILSSVN